MRGQVMFKKLLLSLLIAIPVIAQAEWEEYSIDGERSYHVDLNRVKIVNEQAQIVSYWTKSVYYKDLTKDTMSVGDYYLTFYYGNCSDRTIAKTIFAIYNKNGDLRNTYNFPKNYEAVLPDSRGEVLLNTICHITFEES